MLMVDYCKSCGNGLVGGDKFCRKCGARIVEESVLVLRGKKGKARRIEAPAIPPKPAPEEMEIQPPKPVVEGGVLIAKQRAKPQPEATPVSTPAVPVQEKHGLFGGMFGKKPVPVAGAPTTKAQPAAPAAPVVKLAKEGFMSEHRKRYLERRGELAEQAKQEMLQPAEQARMFRQELVRPGPEAKEQVKGLDLSKLSEISSLKELESLENIEGLSGMEQSGELSLEALAGLAEPETFPKERGMGCPHCASQKSSIVYCPYCGKGFCSNCASKVTPKGDLIFYECPVCTKEVIVKRETQQMAATA